MSMFSFEPVTNQFARPNRTMLDFLDSSGEKHFAKISGVPDFLSLPNIENFLTLPDLEVRPPLPVDAVNDRQRVDCWVMAGAVRDRWPNCAGWPWYAGHSRCGPGIDPRRRSCRVHNADVFQFPNGRERGCRCDGYPLEWGQDP